MKRKTQKNRFTITELVVALGVIIVILGISFNTMGYLGNTKIENSSKKIWKQIHLTREYAVAKHQYIALIFPDDLTEKNSNGSTEDFQNKFPLLANHSMRACKVDRFFEFIEFVDNTEWILIHDTVVIQLPPDSEGSMELVNGVVLDKPNSEYTMKVNKVRAIIFKPTGSTTLAVDIGYENTPIAVVEEVDGGKHLRAEISVNWLTGKPRYEKK